MELRVFSSWGILGGVYRERLELEWRAAMAVAVAALVTAVTSRLPLPFDAWWLFVGVGVVVLVAAGTVLTAVWRRPLPCAAPSTTFGDRELVAAAKRVSRGQDVDSPALQAAAIDRVRRGLRMLPLTSAWQPVLGCGWIVNPDHDGFDVGMDVFGVVMIVFGLAVLGHVRRTHHRLDDLEGRGAPAGTHADAAGQER